MTSVFFFRKIDRENLYSEHDLVKFKSDKREKSRKMCETSGVWRIGERIFGELSGRLCNNAVYTKINYKVILSSLIMEVDNFLRIYFFRWRYVFFRQFFL